MFPFCLRWHLAPISWAYTEDSCVNCSFPSCLARLKDLNTYLQFLQPAWSGQEEPLNLRIVISSTGWINKKRCVVTKDECNAADDRFSDVSFCARADDERQIGCFLYLYGREAGILV